MPFLMAVCKIYWSVHFDGIESTFFFPCKGQGCQCDIAGHELPNCSCDHSIPEPVSCCGPEVCEVDESNFQDSILKSLGCSGFEEDISGLSLKHPPFYNNRVASKETFASVNSFPAYRQSYSYKDFQPILKVPILF